MDETPRMGTDVVTPEVDPPESVAPSPQAQIAALSIAFTELARMLSRDKKLAISQLASVLQTATKGSDVATRAAMADLVRSLRS